MKLTDQQYRLTVAWVIFHCSVACAVGFWFIFTIRVPHEVRELFGFPLALFSQETLLNFRWTKSCLGVIQLRFTPAAHLPFAVFVIIMLAGLIPVAMIYLDALRRIRRGMPHASAATRR